MSKAILSLVVALCCCSYSTSDSNNNNIRGNNSNDDFKVLKDGRRWRNSGGFVYEKGDSIPVVANKVGPYANPSETYNYYRLAYCRPESLKGASDTQLFFETRQYYDYVNECCMCIAT